MFKYFSQRSVSLNDLTDPFWISIVREEERNRDGKDRCQK